MDRRLNPPTEGESWTLSFHDLMPFRIREVLLVSSPYDFFIMNEDGWLAERLFMEYSELNLSSAPRITHAPDGYRARDLMRQRRFDLVISVIRIAEVDINDFARRVKEEDQTMPVVLLIFNEADLIQHPVGVDPYAVDMVFLWTGDPRILLAAIKQIEDRHNALHDVRTAGVRVIIVAEDSIRNYSSFLSQLYTELMAQSQSLIKEGVNAVHKMLRMRARPKILMATNYEKALGLYRAYRENTMAVISDVRMPRDGKIDPEAGFKLVQEIRKEAPGIPVLLESAEPENSLRARSMGVAFLNKNSDDFLERLRGFMKESLGFGPFIFRLPDRSVQGVAHDMVEMKEALAVIPAACLEYHARRNHFSTWLTARSMFGLADKIRPGKIEDFGGIEAARANLVEVLHQARQQEQEGVVTDFTASDTSSRFIRLGTGSMGGKSRGLAFTNAVLAQQGLAEEFDQLSIRVPRSVVLSTDTFDLFLDKNPTLKKVRRGQRLERQELLQLFINAKLPKKLRARLRTACRDLTGPLAVRSSSLLEDSQAQPFAGIYATFMIPNNHPDPEVRLDEICRAIKAVYASAFSEEARAYIAGTPHRLENEKMGVLIQRMVGQERNGRFYPCVSGVALSINHYPVGHQRAEDGVVVAALGLGQSIVSGAAAFQFSPADPTYLPQFPNTEAFLRSSQTQFYALDTTRHRVDFTAPEEFSLVQHGLAAAEEDGTLNLVGSTYSPDDDQIRDTLLKPGPRVVTFNNLLKWKALPMAEALELALASLKEGIGADVELEFALDAGDWGRPGVPASERRKPTLYLLQMRPQARPSLSERVELNEISEERLLCLSNRSLGHGIFREIQDVIYIRRRDLRSNETLGVAEEVGRFNKDLLRRGVPYLLIGPGRWGTSDHRLGIPVTWSQIMGAKVIVETCFEDRVVAPSQGSHFFHNITAHQVGYLTLSNLDGHPDSRAIMDQDWLDSITPVAEGAVVRHLRLDAPLIIHLDGKQGRGAVVKGERER